MAKRPSAVLKVALGANLTLSLSCGLAALVFGSALSDLMGAIPSWFINVVGGGLLVFAAGIGWTVVRLRVGQALIISTLDVLWVLATVPLTLVPGLLTWNGIALVLLLAAAVGALGLAQLVGIRAMLRADAVAESGQYRHCIRVHSSASPDKLWRAIRDLGSISRYSSGLRASRLDGASEPMVGTVRVCTNTRGQSWAEEVVSLDDTARTVVLRFRSDAEDFPFPLTALSGGWTVGSDGRGGAIVDVWWNVTPTQRHFGWLVVGLMTVPLDRDVPRIVSAMEAAAMNRLEPQSGRGLSFGYC